MEIALMPLEPMLGQKGWLESKVFALTTLEPNPSAGIVKKSHVNTGLRVEGGGGGARRGRGEAEGGATAEGYGRSDAAGGGTGEDGGGSTRGGAAVGRHR